MFEYLLSCSPGSTMGWRDVVDYDDLLTSLAINSSAPSDL